MTEEYILSASHLLHAVASFLCMERMATLRHENLPVKIDNYISEHLNDSINVESICNEFNIGKTYLYQIAKESYGMGIAELIRNQRIERTKRLMVEQHLSINEVASLCGFNDYNYFITVFKRITGFSPKKYKQSINNFP